MDADVTYPQEATLGGWPACDNPWPMGSRFWDGGTSSGCLLLLCSRRGAGGCQPGHLSLGRS